MSASFCGSFRACRPWPWWRRPRRIRVSTPGRPTAAPAICLPERLWSLPPATFSGGEQQRVNIARGFIGDHPLLLLDEPTASLDAANRAAVVELIAAKKRAGVALLGIFHDEDVRDRVADRVIDIRSFAPEPA